MYTGFNGKVAVITGGAKGIGAAVVTRLAELGAAVVIADTSSAGSELASQLQSSGLSAEYIRTDVRNANETQDMIAFAKSKFGGLDILINSAGIFPRATLMETTEDLWDKIMDINLKGVYQSCQAAVPLLMQRGEGVIINIGSLNAYKGAPNLFAYATSKGGVMTLTRNLAQSLAKHNIRVNCVHPGWVSSDGEKEVQRAEGLPENWIETEGHKLPLGRIQTPEDIASTVVFMASDQANQITGQSIAVDGGLGLRF